MKSIKKIFLLSILLFQWAAISSHYEIREDHKDILYENEQGNVLLTQEYQEKVLKFMDRFCINTWCESSYNRFDLHAFQCNINQEKCFFAFTMYHYEHPENPISYECFFDIHSPDGMFVINSKSDMFFGAEEGFPMTQTLYYSMSSCIEKAIKKEDQGDNGERVISF